MKRICSLIMCIFLPSCKQENTTAKKSEPGTIVLFNGTSSAGKTSIIKEMQKIYGDAYQVVNLDAFMGDYFITYPRPESMTSKEAEEYFGKVFDAFYTHAK